MFDVFGSTFCETLAHCGAKAKRWNHKPSQYCTFNCLSSIFVSLQEISNWAAEHKSGFLIIVCIFRRFYVC